jgi:hypothetical protein
MMAQCFGWLTQEPCKSLLQCSSYTLDAHLDIILGKQETIKSVALIHFYYCFYF